MTRSGDEERGGQAERRAKGQGGGVWLHRGQIVRECRSGLGVRRGWRRKNGQRDLDSSEGH
jgi:hypothetical protein